MMNSNISPTEGSKLKFFLPVIGIFLIVTGAISLWENQNDYSLGFLSYNYDNVKKDDIIAEMENNLIEIKELDKPSSSLEGKPIHIVGEIKPAGNLIDPDFKIISNSLRLERSVKMYQWIQKEREKRVYSPYSNTRKKYVVEITDEQEWQSGLARSRKNNPVPEFWEKTFLQSRYLLGGYILSSNYVDAINWNAKKYDIPFTEENLHQLPTDIQKRSEIVIDNDSTFLYIDVPGKPKTDSPRIGDLRIRFFASPPQVYSVIGMQKRNSIVPYVSKSGKSYYNIMDGNKSFAEMTYGQSTADEIRLGQWFYFGMSQIVLGFFLMISIPLFKLLKK